jgi:serine/threonine protein kinase
MLVGQQIGPFRIDKEVGSGAMGTVYRGTYTKNGSRVAIKIMAPGLGTTNSNAAQRFEREADILKQLRHPNIVRLFGVGKTHGTRYYAMEFVEGESLDKVMARRERMTWEEVVALGQQLCSALQHAHEKGVIHRDLKPSNLMLLPDGTLKLTDFGIAKDLDSTALTSANCTVGTASYMSPEQCRGERDMTNKSDLYSLGVVFYELVTGRKPFNADNAMEMFIQHVSGDFERPSRLVLDLPVWFDNLICQMLEKKPEHRPLDAAMIAHTLNTIQEKVEAQQSAGVDAARSRRIDRPRGNRSIDENDRDAARTLKDGKRKRRKNTGPRFYERGWFVVAGVLAVLLAMATFCYFVFFTAPSLDQLHAQAKRLIDMQEPKWDDALDGPLHQFEVNYPNAGGDKADQMRLWAAEGHYRHCFDQIKKHLQRVRAGKPHFANSDEEKIAFPTALAEEAGEFDKAETGWKQLQQQVASGPWRVFADRRLQEMDRAKREGDRLQAELDKIKEFRRDLDPQHADFEILTALRFEQFGDYLSALTEFDRLKAQYIDQAGARVSYLFAAKKVVDLKPKSEKKFGSADPLGVRLTLLDSRLKEATELEEMGKLADAYSLLLDIKALYAKSTEPEIKNRVEQAQKREPGLRDKMKLLD